MRNLQNLAVVSSLAIGSLAAAQNAVEWRVADGGNGHWYAGVIVRSTGASWTEARAHAQAMGGDLASLLSAPADQFVFERVVNNPALWSGVCGPWVGGWQQAGSAEPSGGWRWVNGDPIAESLWSPDQPDDATYCGGDNNRMGYWNAYQGAPRKYLEDSPDSAVIQCGSSQIGLMVSAVVEWSADCNNDGIVDYTQCRDGSLPDFNGNNIPDCCEQGSACIVGNYPVQWRVADGGNGHWYAAIENGANINWIASRDAAVARGGHLATIGSAGENAVVSNLVIALGGNVFLGGYQIDPSASANVGWTWVDGSPWSYTNWNEGEPNDQGSPNESYLEMWGTTWSDTPVAGSVYQTHRYSVEWDADCNNDGIVDYGQILSGQLADANHNNIPDTCESSSTVPTQYPTIQAAINAAPASAPWTINVLAGTYHESFRMNGKNVVVRGAANGTTIIDGTGLTKSIAQIIDNEPPTAGLENLVFRNGTSGTLYPPVYEIYVGGAIFASNSSAFLRNCRFENCRADFGGALYQYVGGVSWQNCVFSNNIADIDGGGALIYNTTGTIVGSTFTGNRVGTSGPGSGSAIKVVGSNGDGESVVLDTCTMTGNFAGDSGSAVEVYEHTKYHPVVLHIVNSLITGNTSGDPLLFGAAGLRVIGRESSCIVSGSTSICANAPIDVSGPFLLEGSAIVCGCFADITGDGSVNGGDLGVLLSSWGIALPSGIGDVNHDGVVNAADLAVLLSSWGSCH